METVNVDGVNDGTFKANFRVDGELKLRERVNEKLKELIGDSTDGILVDYVIMLLKNGRCKEEALNQLNHILGDDSGSFVCWLWNHLTLNTDLYFQPKDLQDDRSPKRTISDVQIGGVDNRQLNSESGRVTSDKLCRSRRNKGWEELARGRKAEPPPLRSSDVFDILAEKRRSEVDNSGPRSSSSSPANRRMNRGHLGKRKTNRGGAASQETIGPPRRLLQSAIRDALPLPTSSPGPPVQPSSKRLRSLVSNPIHDEDIFNTRGIVVHQVASTKSRNCVRD